MTGSPLNFCIGNKLVPLDTEQPLQAPLIDIVHFPCIPLGDCLTFRTTQVGGKIYVFGPNGCVSVKKHVMLQSYIWLVRRLGVVAEMAVKQWRRQNVKTARSFTGQYSRKAGH